MTTQDDPSQSISLPSFDHALQDPVEGDIAVQSTAKVVILEGNYTLLDQWPWNEIATMAHDRYHSRRYFSVNSQLMINRWFVQVPREVAKARISKRHLKSRVERCQIDAECRAEDSDLPNGDLLVSNLVQPYLVVHN